MQEARSPCPTRKKQVKELIVERLWASVEPDAIGDDADLRDLVDLDSPKIIDIVVGLEEVFGISFEGDENFNPERFHTVNSILALMDEKQGNS